MISAGVFEFSTAIFGMTSNMARTKRVYHLSTSTRRSEFLKIFSMITENSFKEKKRLKITTYSSYSNKQ